MWYELNQLDLKEQGKDVESQKFNKAMRQMKNEMKDLLRFNHEPFAKIYSKN